MKKRLTVAFICGDRRNGLVHEAGILLPSTVFVDALKPQKIVSDETDLALLLPKIRTTLEASGRVVVALFSPGTEEGRYVNRSVKFISDGATTARVKNVLAGCL